MHKTLTFALVLLALITTNARASIVYKDISPNFQTTLDPSIQSMSNLKSIDFDGDGNEEYNFSWEDFSTSSGNWFAYMTFTSSNKMVMSSSTSHPSGSGYIQALSSGTSIGSGSNWGNSNPDPLISDNSNGNFQGLGDQYIGVQFSLTTGTHYGWILVSFDNSKTLTLKEFAYEDSPNTSIKAGDKSSSKILVSSITVDGAGGKSTITTSGGTLQMEATVMPTDAADKSVTWSVTNMTGSATINTSGVLQAVSDGTVKVTAKANDGSNVTGSKTITISNQSISVSSISVQGQGGVSTIDMIGGNLQMEATVLPANATDKTVTWSVSNMTGSATISTAGLLIATAVGTVSVTATANDGSSVSGSTIVTITNDNIAVTSISVQGQGGVSTITTPAGTLQMEATVMPNDATDKTVTWSVSDMTGTATIDGNGLLTAVSDGTVSVTATANDGSGISGSTTITISNQSSGIAKVIKQQIQLYPNPVNDRLYFKSLTGEKIDGVYIRTTTGQEVLAFQPGSDQSIDIAGLTPGAYFVSVSSETSLKTFKIFKN